MNTKHTLGPWVVDEKTTMESICTVYGTDCDQGYVYITPVGREYSNPEQQTANARLIATAPELLEALENCEAFLLSAGFGSSDSYAEVVAAIAKATGETS
jgi:hypothetical protein